MYELFLRFRQLIPGVALLSVLTACTTASVVPDDPKLEEYEPGPDYHIYMAEIARERGEWVTVAEQYLEAAKLSEDPYVARRATEFAYDIGYGPVALESAERWVEVDPENPVAHAYLGRIAFRAGDLDRAADEFAKFLGPDNLRVDEDYLLIAVELEAAGDPEGATEVMRQLKAADPDSLGAGLGLASVAMRAGEMDLSLSEARRVADAEPEWLEAQLLLAWAYLAADQPDAAFGRMDSVLGREETVVARVEYVRMLALAGEVERATELLDRSEALYPMDVELIRLRAQVSQANDDNDVARNAWARLLAEQAYTQEALYNLGELALRDGETDDALAWYQQVSGGGYLIQARQRMAIIQARSGDVEGALNGLDQFAAAYPRAMVSVALDRATLQSALGRHETAAVTLQEALVLEPGNTDLLLSLGGQQELAGDTDAAIETFREALANDPDNPLMLNALGYTLADANVKLREARRLIKRAIELDPENPAIMDSMGWVLYRQGRSEEALVWLQKAWARLEDPEVGAHLGEVLWELGRRDEALQVWNESRVLNPDDKVLSATLERYGQ